MILDNFAQLTKLSMLTDATENQVGSRWSELSFRFEVGRQQKVRM